MNFIKNVKELNWDPKSIVISDERVEESIAREIEDNNRKGEFKVYIMQTKYYQDQPFGHQYNYVKKHKKELKEKGYKIHFNLSSVLVWPDVSYTIKWKGNK